MQTVLKKQYNIFKKDFEGILFTNLVDYDMVYGHRNDVEGYKNALLYFDKKLPEIIHNLKQQDILFTLLLTTVVTLLHLVQTTAENMCHCLFMAKTSNKMSI